MSGAAVVQAVSGDAIWAAARYRAESRIEIAAPPAAVWEVLADFCGLDQWARGVTRCDPIGSVAQGVGAGRRIQIKGLGRVDEVVNLWEPERHLRYAASAVGPFGPGASSWRLEPVESAGARRTRVTLRFAYDMRFGALGRLLHALLVRDRIQSAESQTLERLKRHVEGRLSGRAA
ncbi:MAG: SRPBCC family protein [Nevskiales bacterium]